MLQPPQHGQVAPDAFRKRLGFVVVALVAAQLMYVTLAAYMMQHGFKPTGNALPRKLFTVVTFVLGILGAIASFPAAGFAFRRQSAEPNLKSTIVVAAQKQFFVGFALSEIASLAGLLIFFLFADFTTLVFLVCVACTAIAAHYLRVRKTVEDFERTSG